MSVAVDLECVHLPSLRSFFFFLFKAPPPPTNTIVHVSSGMIGLRHFVFLQLVFFIQDYCYQVCSSVFTHTIMFTWINLDSVYHLGAPKSTLIQGLCAQSRIPFLTHGRATCVP